MPIHIQEVMENLKEDLDINALLLRQIDATIGISMRVFQWSKSRILTVELSVESNKKSPNLQNKELLVQFSLLKKLGNAQLVILYALTRSKLRNRYVSKMDQNVLSLTLKSCLSQTLQNI